MGFSFVVQDGRAIQMLRGGLADLQFLEGLGIVHLHQARQGRVSCMRSTIFKPSTLGPCIVCAWQPTPRRCYIS